MDVAAFDMEFGFRGRPFDYGVVVPVCGVLRIAGGPTVTACPGLGRPWDLLRSYLDDPDLLIAMHHGVFAERQVLRHLGLGFPVGHFWDTEVVERVLHIVTRGDLAKDQPVPGNGPYTLLACLARRGVVRRDAPAKKALQITIGQLAFAPSELPEIVTYCEQDVEDTLTLARLQLRDVAQMPESMRALLLGLLLPHALRVADLASTGILFDRDSYARLVTDQDRLLTGKQRELQQLGFVGTFTHPREKLTVPGQNLAVCRTLEHLGLDHVLHAARVYKADADKAPEECRRSLDGIFKEGHKSASPFLRAAKDYHDLIDLLSRDWTQFIDHDGRIRPSVVFPGSSSYRAIQLMPNPLMLPYFARPLFHAAPGHALVELDFKAQEVGLAADWFGDERLLALYNGFDLDLYAEIGATMGIYPVAVGGVPDPKMDPKLRQVIKTAVLGLQYGIGTRTLSGQLNLSENQTRALLHTFWTTFSALNKGRSLYLDHTRGTGIAPNRAGLLRGYRPYQYRNGKRAPSELSYQNFPVQSGGSAVLMLTLRALPPWANVVLTMHDALLLEVPVEAVGPAAAATRHAMATGLHALFPRVRSRTEARASWRYAKEAPDSLHRFCHTLGVDLHAEAGWEAPAELLVDRGAPPPPLLCPPSPSPSSLPCLSI